MEPVMLTENCGRAHSRRGGIMRTFRSLLPVLFLILLTSVVLARPAGVARTGRSLGVEPVKLPLCSGLGSPPSPRLDFGTVVRDTADEQGFGPGRGEMPRDMPRWTSFFIWSWVDLLLVQR